MPSAGVNSYETQQNHSLRERRDLSRKAPFFTTVPTVMVVGAAKSRRTFCACAVAAPAAIASAALARKRRELAPAGITLL
jgi:hypothetical protein